MKKKKGRGVLKTDNGKKESPFRRNRFKTNKNV